MDINHWTTLSSSKHCILHFYLTLPTRIHLWVARSSDEQSLWHKSTQRHHCSCYLKTQTESAINTSYTLFKYIYIHIHTHIYIYKKRLLSNMNFYFVSLICLSWPFCNHSSLTHQTFTGYLTSILPPQILPSSLYTSNISVLTEGLTR